MPNYDRPTVAQEMTVPPRGKGKKVTFDKNTKVAEPYFDKSSAQISNLVYKPGLVDIHVVDIQYTTTKVNSNFTSNPYAIHMG